MHFNRDRSPRQAQILTLSFFLFTLVLLSSQQFNVSVGLWLMFILAAGAYCTVQCAQRFSGLTKGNKIMVLLVVLALGWKMFRMQAAIAAPIGGSDPASAVNAEVHLLWSYLSPIFSAFLLVIIILSPEAQLTERQIRDRRTFNKLWWQQRVSRTSKVLFYTTVLFLLFMAAWTVVDQVSDNAWSVYLTSSLLIFLPDMLLHVLGLVFYAELLAGNSSALKAASGSA